MLHCFYHNRSYNPIVNVLEKAYTVIKLVRKKNRQMKMEKLICPHCGAALSVGNEIDSFYCQFCGGKILVTGQDKNAISAKVKLKEFEHKERIHKSNQEHELNKIKVEQRETKWGTSILLLLLLLIFGFGFLLTRSARNDKLEHQAVIARLYSIEEQVGKAMDEKDYEKALFYANQLYSDGYSSTDKDIWNSKRESFISMIKDAQRKQMLTDENVVFMPISSDDLFGKDYIEIVDYLSAIGFTNISTQKALERASKKNPKNTIEHLLIGGQASFTIEDYFDKDTPIIIYYYAK